MNAAYQWLTLHPVWMTSITLAAYHVAAAFVGALEMPDATSSKFYRFFFRFTNILAANYARSSASNGPAGMQPPKPDSTANPQPPQAKVDGAPPKA